MTQISKIQEIPATDRPAFVPTWRFQTSWNGESTFQYPNHRAQLERFRWFLEKYAHADPLNSSKASQVRKELEYYRNALFNSLSHSQISPSTKYIDVHDYGEESTFHSVPWELLESRQSSITVRRRVNSAPFPTAPTVPTVPTPETFNILIVAARALKHKEDYRQAALPVLRVIQDLPDGAPLVTVEIARPGEFVSLKKHLEDVKGRRNGFTYHLVHLDLHGKVSKKGQATLEFADKVVPAAKVSQLLTSNGVQYAVINACESARSDRGAKGNLAKIFTKNGMIAVLAMSYEISVGAVSFLTRQFYEAFLHRNLAFARAAQAARQAMRSQPHRTGRFGILVELEDWMVPVVYCSVDDDCIVRSSKTVSRIHQQLPGFFHRSDGALVPEPTDLDGRDADILELEWRLLDNSQKGVGRLMFLDGPNGVGKTSFLRHLQWWWAVTGMISRSIYVNMNDYREKSLNEMCSHVLRQFGGHRPARNNTESLMVCLQVHLGKMAQEADKASNWKHPKPLLIFDHFFSTEWPLGKRSTTMRGTTPETWKAFFQILSNGPLFTIVASHRWPWYLDDHERSEFPGRLLYVLAPVVIKRVGLTQRGQTFTGLIKGPDDIERLDLILKWCGPDLGLRCIIVQLVRKLGAAKTATMLTRGDDLLVCPEFPRRLLQRLPMWETSKNLWKNAPKSLRELLIAFAPFHGRLPRCYEEYCLRFVVNKRALTHPVWNFFARFNPEAAKASHRRLLTMDLLLLVKHIRLLPMLKCMGLIKADLMMGPTTMQSGLPMGTDHQAEGSMLHSIHPVFSLFLRHEAQRAGYLQSKEGTLSRQAICLEKTFVDYHESRIDELLESSSTVESLWDQQEIALCALSFTAAMETHLRSPMDRFEKVHPTPGLLAWKWANSEGPVNGFVAHCTEKALFRCQEELAKTTNHLTRNDIAISAAQLTLHLATHHLLCLDQCDKFVSYVDRTDDLLGIRYFGSLSQDVLDSLWPERAQMVDQLNAFKRIQVSLESNEFTHLTILAELPPQTIHQPSAISESLSSGWNLVRRALKLTEHQLQLCTKSSSLTFWDTEGFCQALQVLQKETDDFLTALAPIWPELLSSCEPEFLCKIRLLGFRDTDDGIKISADWDDISQDLLKVLPQMPNYASSFMAAIRNGISAAHARHEFLAKWLFWVKSHARSWMLKFYDLSLQVESEEIKSVFDIIQIIMLRQLEDPELSLDHQQCLLVVERSLPFQELDKSQISRRIGWHTTTAILALQLSRWDLCHDNLFTILGLASNGGNVNNQQLFCTLLLFSLLQMMAPPRKPHSMSITGALYQALALGYGNKGIYARNGALLSLLLHSTDEGCLTMLKKSSAGPKDRFRAMVKPEVHAHMEFMLSMPHTSSSKLDCKELERHLAAIRELQRTRTTFPNSTVFSRRLQQQLNARKEENRAVMAEAENHLCQHSPRCGCPFDPKDGKDAAATLEPYELLKGFPGDLPDRSIRRIHRQFAPPLHS
ncbi:hypothetical protein HIM_10296 [Hirsutella minnesotensis 3608]|uniref:CHAT domain-containing protein n=1 Tax=Hirsutella minnesotensis 3608 TaxID=1043627 RepID=A0A0F7ZRW6_9HYPO|nr:hypothetical protein HIM_10296 [Hirsutella minnesotensis 3608]